jgi:hypothetical protein
MREGAMSNVRNWTSSFIVAALILLAPIIAFVVVVAAEVLTDLVAKVGGTAVWPVVAGAMGWVLLRKYGWQPRTTAVMPLGTAIALFSTVAHVLMIVMLLLLPGDARPRHREP